MFFHLKLLCKVSTNEVCFLVSFREGFARGCVNEHEGDGEYFINSGGGNNHSIVCSFAKDNRELLSRRMVVVGKGLAHHGVVLCKKNIKRKC